MAARKRELGLGGGEVFVPQSYTLGQEAQVDWFEATAKLSGENCVLQFFAMRSMATGWSRRSKERCGWALRMPDTAERRRYEIALSEELAAFERPQPVMDEYDLLLAAPLPGKEVIQ